MEKFMHNDGVVKYRSDHVNGPPLQHMLLKSLDAVRTFLFQQRLTGQTEAGIGYGNISLRQKPGAKPFIISATSTGGIEHLGSEGYSLVHEYSLQDNWLRSHGPKGASSESLTHAGIYEAKDAVNCIAHIHNERLFRILSNFGAPRIHTNYQKQDIALLCTPQSAAYGTPEIALAAKSVAAQGPDKGIIVMLGHLDGIIVYAKNIGELQSILKNLISKIES